MEDEERDDEQSHEGQEEADGARGQAVRGEGVEVECGILQP